MKILAVICLVGVIGGCLAAYSANTDALYNELDECHTGISSDIECVEAVRDGLQQMSDYIQDVRDLKDDMQTLSNGMNTFNAVAGIAKYVPYIGTAVNIVKNTLTAIRTPFNQALARVKTIDAKIWPYKARCDTGVEHCETAITYMGFLQTACADGRSHLGTTRSCVNSMAAGTLKTTCTTGLEQLGGALASPFDTANQALGSVGSGCAAIRSLTDIVLGWPDISFIISGIDDVLSALDPILDFFAELQNALNTNLCIPDPFEALAEWELVEELAESPVNPGNWGWGRRKRSLALRTTSSSKSSSIRLTRSEASNLLSSSLVKRGSACFSAQDILDGIDSIFAPLIDLANDLISEILSVLPDISLPGFPDFNNLFNLNIDFNLPDISFGFDLSDYTDFIWLNWNCATQIGNMCNTLSGGLSVSCGQSIGDYVPNWGGWGRKRRSTLQAMDNDKSTLISLLEKITRSQKLGTSSRREVEKVEKAMSEKKSQFEARTITVSLGPNTKRDRQDDKDLSSTEADDIISHLTEEQKARLQEALREKGVSVPDEREAAQMQERRAMLAALFA